jgi:hypothetical protein
MNTSFDNPEILVFNGPNLREGYTRRTIRLSRSKPTFGELVQLDGSHHQWFEKRAPNACLMNMVDDAQGTTLSWLAEEETIFAAMQLLWHWIDRYGIPQSLYTDRKKVYVIVEKTREKAADSGEEVFTQFGRACRQLGIKIITAHSPEAKGRVERNHGIYQDRLVKELRLAQIDTIAAGNQFLQNDFATNSMKDSPSHRARRLTFTVRPKVMTWPASFVSKKKEQ